MLFPEGPGPSPASGSQDAHFDNLSEVLEELSLETVFLGPHLHEII